MLMNNSCNSCPSYPKSALSEIPSEILEELNNIKVTNIYKKGQTIFYEGNRPVGVFCMKSGVVKLSKSHSDGKYLINKIASNGDLLGYSSFFTGENYCHTAEVLEEAIICFLDKESFLGLLKKFPPFCIQLLNLLGHDIRCAQEKSTNLAYKSTQERIIETFLVLNEAYGIENGGGIRKIDFQLSRDDLAGMIGASTETTVRLLTWLKEKGLVVTREKFLYLNDLPSLKELISQH